MTGQAEMLKGYIGAKAPDDNEVVRPSAFCMKTRIINRSTGHARIPGYVHDHAGVLKHTSGSFPGINECDT